ncbi:MAG: BrnA antitoxin family protein [Stellaceae bacterium]
MPTRKRITESKWIDPDDAPELTKEWFESAEIWQGGKLIRPARPAGRPKSGTPKEAISLRLDPDVVAHFRATGPGWQSRINQALRKAAKLSPPKPAAAKSN